MFGKRSSTDNFVMAMGRKAGNIKTAKAGPAVQKKIGQDAMPGAGKAPKPGNKPGLKAPVQAVATKMIYKSPSVMGAGLHDITGAKPLSLGKANTFNVSGKRKG